MDLQAFSLSPQVVGDKGALAETTEDCRVLWLM